MIPLGVDLEFSDPCNPGSNPGRTFFLVKTLPTPTARLITPFSHSWSEEPHRKLGRVVQALALGASLERGTGSNPVENFCF